MPERSEMDQWMIKLDPNMAAVFDANFDALEVQSKVAPNSNDAVDAGQQKLIPTAKAMAQANGAAPTAAQPPAPRTAQPPASKGAPAQSTASTKLAKDEVTAAHQRMVAFQEDIDDALARYQAAKAGAEQLATVTNHQIADPGKDLTSRAETLRTNLASWSKALQDSDRNAAIKAEALVRTTDKAMMQVLTQYESAVQSAKPDKLPGRTFKTPWGDLMARDEKGAAAALAIVADLSKALAADYTNFNRYFASADMLDHVLRAKPMADFLKNPESVQAAVQKAAQDNKGKIGDAEVKAEHADSLERTDEALLNQLAAVKIQTDQMTASLAAIAAQVASETDAEMAAQLTEKAEKTEAAYEYMGEFVACLTDPKEAAGKLKDFAVKIGFKILAKLDTQEIRKRAADLKELADEKHKDSLTKASDALITALSKFDDLAPALEKQLSESAKRFESQVKQAGEKFDDVCEKCDFHFYDVEGAVKDAQKALDAAVSAREALEENALGLPAAIGRAVLRSALDFGAMEGAMESAVTHANAPTIDTARSEVERKIKEWRTREEKLGESLGQLLEVRKKALQALADFGG